MLFEVSGNLVSVAILEDRPTKNVLACKNQEELANYFWRTFLGEDGVDAAVGELSLHGTVFENTYKFSEKWGYRDKNGELTISNGSDGFLLDHFDFEAISSEQRASETTELSVRHTAGFSVAVEADSAELAGSLTKSLGLSYFVINCAWEDDQLEIESIEIDHINPF